jgi:hypothetical protein
MKKERKRVYPVPVITRFMLKAVMPLILDDTFSVRVAVVTWLTANAVPSLFQVRVIGPSAFTGFQFVFARLSVTWAVPRFLT